MSDDRLKDIHNAATMLFIQQGYSRTQISHIAKKVGVSVGTIYNYFIGKKEIMHFMLQCSIDNEFINNDFNRPITDELFKGLDSRIIETFNKNISTFRSHLADNSDQYSFEQMVSDAFDILHRYAEVCLFIEKNISEFGELSKLYISYRKKFLMIIEEYLKIYMYKGEVRKLKNTALTSIMIIDILSWWAMDRRYKAFELLNISKETAKEECLSNIINAYKA